MGLNVSMDYTFQLENKDILKNTAKNILNKKIATYECFKYKNNNVKSRKIIYSKTPEKLSAKVIYVINKNIALPQKIQVDNEQIDETGVDENNNDWVFMKMWYNINITYCKERGYLWEYCV